MNGNIHDQSTPQASPADPVRPDFADTSEPAGGSSLEDERDLLGRLLTDPDNQATASRTALVCQETGLRAEDFYHAEHRPVYTAAMSLAGQGRPGGVTEVESELLAMSQLDLAGGSHALRVLARRVSSETRSPMELALSVANKATARRGAAELLQRWRNLQFGVGDAAGELRSAAENLSGISSRRQEPTRIRPLDGQFAPAAQRMINLRERNALHPSIVPTGNTELDYRGGGLLRRGRLTVTLGRSGIGKTTYAFQTAIQAGTTGADRQSVALFYLEGQQEDMVQRMVELKAGRDHHSLSETESWRAASADLDTGRFLFDAGGRRGVEAITSAGPAFVERGVKLVVVDSFELLDAAGGALDEKLAWPYVLRSLKALAQNYNLAVWLNRVLTADTVEEARAELQDSEGKIDIAALLSREGRGAGGLERRKLSVFHNRNGALVDVFMEIHPSRFGALLPVERPA